MAKRVVAKTVGKNAPKRPAQTRARVTNVQSPSARKPSGGVLDRVFDLVKWIDSPFKLATVLVLGVLGLAGHIIYQQQDKIFSTLTSPRETMPELLVDERLASLGRDLLRDLGAETLIIHQIDLASNSRLTRIALSQDGRFAPLEGRKGAFFSGSPARNKAAVTMLNGEVLCEPFEPSSDVGDWLISRGVTFACRGSVPPDPGHMAGYISVGFKKEPRDMMSVKTRINQTSREMAK